MSDGQPTPSQESTNPPASESLSISSSTLTHDQEQAATLLRQIIGEASATVRAVAEIVLYPLMYEDVHPIYRYPEAYNGAHETAKTLIGLGLSWIDSQHNQNHQSDQNNASGHVEDK